MKIIGKVILACIALTLAFYTVSFTNGVQGTLHKVSGPLTPDVRHRKQ